VITSIWQMSDRWLAGRGARISDGLETYALDRFSAQTRFGNRLEELRGKSVLLIARSQLDAVWGMVELDGVARRIIICPPDASDAFAGAAVQIGNADVVVGDSGRSLEECPAELWKFELRQPEDRRAATERTQPTEWVLPTSGTSGPPKLVVHTLATLSAAFSGATHTVKPVSWGTFYDIRRFGGLQILLRTLIGGGSLFLAGAQSTGEFLRTAGGLGVTHISGTPSHWRRVLMAGEPRGAAPDYVRLSGEIADQAILDGLARIFPAARIAHAFASTEAGVAFEVEDGISGFPAGVVEPSNSDVRLEVRNGSLHVRSNRMATHYLGGESPLKDDRGFIDTGDLVERQADRYRFIGRRTGVINVGGLKVHPEEVEAIINRHPSVQMSRVMAKASRITGAIVIAQIMPRAGLGAIDFPAIEEDVIRMCRRGLPAHKVPARIQFVQTLEVGSSGKLVRHHA